MKEFQQSIPTFLDKRDFCSGVDFNKTVRFKLENHAFEQFTNTNRPKAFCYHQKVYKYKTPEGDLYFQFVSKYTSP